MSATGRNLPGREVHPLGSYDTPFELCRAAWWRFLDCAGPQRRALEPHVGAGNWIRAMQTVPPGWNHERVQPPQIEAMDLDPDALGLACTAGLGGVVTPCAPPRDALEAGFIVTAPATTPDLVIGNPPYGVLGPPRPCPRCTIGIRPDCRRCKGSGEVPAMIPVAELHVRRALEVTARHVLFLLRAGFLAAAERQTLWTAHPPRAVWHVVQRPSFRGGGGTDSTDYVVVWWDRTWHETHHLGSWLSWR